MAEEQINSLVNLAAEQSLIGGVLILGFDADFRERTDYVFQNVRESDFYSSAHKIIWREICAMTDKAKSVDVITLFDIIESKGMGEKIGGFAYLSEIAKGTPSAANINAYADIVVERSNAREVLRRMNAAREIITKEDGRSLAIRLAEASDITAGIDQISSGRMLFNPVDVISSQLETIDEDYSLIEKIFNECIKHKDITLLTGAGGTGKSWLTIKLGISVALGRPALGGKYNFLTPVEQGVVVFLIGEDSVDDYRHRLDKLIKAAGMTRDEKAHILSSILFVPLRDKDIRLIKRERGGDLEQTGVIRNLAASLKACNCRLAILDPMNKFASGEENSNNEANVFINAVRRVVDLSGSAVLMVHHSSKNDPGGSRGASALVDGARCHLALATMSQLKGEKAEPGDDDVIRLTMPKHNNFKGWDGPVWLKRSDAGDMLTIDPPEMIGTGAIAKRFHVDTTRVKSLIIECIRSNTRAISTSEFINAFIEGPGKELCPNYGKAKDIIGEMLNDGILEEGTMFNRKVLLVAERESEDFTW